MNNIIPSIFWKQKFACGIKVTLRKLFQNVFGVEYVNLELLYFKKFFTVYNVCESTWYEAHFRESLCH